MRGRITLKKSIVWNITGSVSPLVLGLYAIPVLISGLGEQKFGLLVLTWTFIGYFTIFDLGIGRSLTQIVADRLGTNRTDGLVAIVWSSLLILLALSLIGGLLVYIFAQWIVGKLILSGDMFVEARQAFETLALGIPFVICSTGLRGVLEAYQRFDYVNMVRVPFGVLTFLGPLLVLPFTKNLADIVLLLVFLRVVSFLSYLVLVSRLEAGFWKIELARFAEIKLLAKMGGWMTLSNLVAPIMVHVDRFVIGSVISAAAITYYSVPFEVVTKFLIIPAALSSVFFPAFASNYRGSNAKVLEFLSRSLWGMILLLFPCLLIFFTVVDFGLEFWLGAEFAKESATLARWLTVGVFLNGISQTPFAFIQGCGRPDITAKFHLAEAPIYLILLWWGIASFGLKGAAIAWTIRVGLDLILLLIGTRLLFADSHQIIVGVKVFILKSVIVFCAVEVFISFVDEWLVLIGVCFFSMFFIVKTWKKATGNEFPRL